jgi:hypothetical protein
MIISGECSNVRTIIPTISPAILLNPSDINVSGMLEHLSNFKISSAGGIHYHMLAGSAQVHASMRREMYSPYY